MSAHLTVIDALRANGRNVVERGTQASAQCPAHDDGNPSLSIRQRDDGNGVLVHCHAGCDHRDVLAAIGLTAGDLFDEPRLRDAYRDSATYAYPDGRKVHRKPGKSFPQSGNTKGRALFGADRIGDACLVYVVEGEKDCLAIEGMGGTAVCSAMGAGKAKLADWSPLADLDVIVVADRDEPGRRHAADVRALLAGVAKSVTVAQSAEGKDAADHIAAGYGLHEFVSVVGHPDDDIPLPDEPPRDDDHQDAITVTPEGLPRLWRAADLRPAEPPRWLAKGRLPLAAISLLVGDEGIGKSLLWVLIAAAITTGKALPAFGIPKRGPGRVLLICTEDEWTSTVRPRLDVAGADISMVDVICTEDDGSGAPVFPRDLHLIAVADPAPALIVVDAWLDTVSAGLSVRDPQQARQALHPWKEVATLTDAAVLLLTHTNRVASTNPRDRYGISGELRKKARMTLFAQADEDGNLVVGPEKMNTAATVPASVFAITAVQHFRPTEDNDGTVPVLSYVGESEMTAREHLAAAADPEAAEPGGNPAQRFLQDYLTRNGGETPAGDAIKAGRAAGFSEQEMKDARRRSKPRIESRKPTFGDGWVWAFVTDQGGSTDQGGTKARQGGEDGTQGAMPPAMPPTPPSPPSQPRVSTPSGGITGATPGITDRMKAALAKATAAAEPRCGDCGQPLLTDASVARGRCAECQVMTTYQPHDLTTTNRKGL